MRKISKILGLITTSIAVFAIFFGISGNLYGNSSSRMVVNAASAVNYIDENGAEQIIENYTSVTSSTTTWSSGWYVVDSDVTLSTRVTVSGDVKLILKDGYTLNATKGITVSTGNSFTVYAQSSGDSMGKLIATGDSYTLNNKFTYGNAGIGGYSNSAGYGSAGTIIINGGYIEATGGNGEDKRYGAAGLGGGGMATAKEGGTIVINAGTVIAIGGTRGGTGIGGGYNGSFTSITINGGNVTSIGIGGAAGIGAGGGCTNNVADKITINGGTINAMGGNIKTNNSSPDAIGNSGTFNYQIGNSGGGTAAGVHQSTYTITIPAETTLGSYFNVTASNIDIPEGKQLNVKLSSEDYEDGSFVVKYVDDTNIFLRYNIMKIDIANNGVQSSPLGNDSNIISVTKDDITDSSSTVTARLETELNDDYIYSGDYEGSLTFTISLD